MPNFDTIETYMSMVFNNNYSCGLFLFFKLFIHSITRVSSSLFVKYSRTDISVENWQIASRYYQLL